MPGRPLDVLFPWGAVLGLLLLAAAMLGADEPAAGLLVSFLILAATAGACFHPAVRPSRLVWLMVCLVGLLYALAVVRGWASTGAAEYASLFAATGVFAIAQAGARAPERATVLWNATLFVGLLLGVIAFYDTVITPEKILWLDRPNPSHRLATPFLSPNTAGTFFGLFSILAIGGVLEALARGVRAKSLVLPLVSLLVCLTCMLMTGSRGAITAFAAGALVLLGWTFIAAWRRGDRRGVLSPLGLFIASLLVAAFWLSGSVVSERVFAGIDNAGGSARVVMFDAYVRAIGDAPVFGHGLGGFEFINARSARADNAATIMYQNAAHNVGLQWILQTGLVGFAGLAVIAGLIGHDMRRGLDRRRSQRPLIRAAIVAALFVLGHGMVDFALEIPGFMWLFAWVLGIGAGLATGGRRTSRARGRWAPIAFSVVFAVGALLSGSAFLDRAQALSIAKLDGSEFLAAYGSALPERGSARLYTAIGDRALAVQSRHASIAAAAYERSVVMEPRDGLVWAKLSMARLLSAPGDPAAVIDALRQSYFVMPYSDRSVIRWRLDYVATVWGFLPEDVRAAARREARIAPHAFQTGWEARVANR